MNRSHNQIAAMLRVKIAARHALLSTSQTADQYYQTEADAAEATHVARYLGNNLAGVDRPDFLRRCGLVADAMEARRV